MKTDSVSYNIVHLLHCRLKCKCHLSKNEMNKCQLKLKMHESNNGMKLRKVHIAPPPPPFKLPPN